MKNQWIYRTSGSLFFLIMAFFFWPATSTQAQMSSDAEHAHHVSGSCGICLLLPAPGEVPGTCTDPDACLPTRERVKLWDVNTYPNPATEWLQLTIDGGYDPMNVGVRIVDMNEIRHFERPALGARNVRLPVEFLAPGNYLLQLMLQGEVVGTHRIKIYR